MTDLSLTFPPELVDAFADAVAARLAVETDGSAGPYLAVPEAAEYLACPKSRIYELVETGRLEPYRDNRRLLFTRPLLDGVLTRQELD